MRNEVPASEVALDFEAYVERVIQSGEPIFLMRDGRAIAELRPCRKGMTLGDLTELLKSLPRLSPENAEAFAADIEAARAEMNAAPLRDPWES